jgi:hypothetical protein
MSNGGNQGTVQAKETPRGAPQIAPFTVECGDEGNRQIPLDMMRMWLRGAWKSQNIKCDMGPEMRKMPDSPGIYLEVKPRDSTLRIFDPLSLPKNATLLQNLNKAVEDITSVKTGTGRKLGPMLEVVHTLDEDQLKTVMLEISRKVYGPMPCMTAVQGTVPTAQELKGYPGRELNDPWNSSQFKAKYVDQRKEFEDRFERMFLLSEAAGAMPS